MLNSKLQRLKDLIEQKEKIDAELEQILGEADKPKRGRPKKDEDGGQVAPET